MPYDQICEAQAEVCDLLADEACDLAWAAEWRRMAEEWRVAAKLSANDNDDPAAAQPEASEP